jgi:ketosteroid isomerase-like protein
MADLPNDGSKEAEVLMELSRQWSAVVASGDLDSAMNYWAEDAVMLPPDLPRVDGKEAIRDHVKTSKDIPGFKISWEPISAHVSKSGDLAYMIERNVTELDGADGNKIVTHGKVVTVWRKDSAGQWKNVVDIWNATPNPNV